jgi:hypothetical protein
VRRIGWRVTPASALPTLVAFVLAGFLGLPGGSVPDTSVGRAPLAGAARAGAALAGAALAGAARAGPGVSAPVHTATTQVTTQARTNAPATAQASMATDALRPSRLAQTGGTAAGHAGPGAALATLSFRLSLDRLRHLLAISASGHAAGIDFSSFRSRAPPRTSW